MASNNSGVHPDYDPNIIIKNEPCTESESSVSTPPTIPNLITNIKVEPGLQTIRLTSVRGRRDLTLGGNIKTESKPRKVIAPNLNVQRKKNREDQNAANDDNSSKPNKRNRDKGKNDKGRDKGKGRGKPTSNLVQSSGIFSDGLADLGTKRYSSGDSFRDRDGSDRGAAILERPKLTIPQKINKAEEAEKLRELLRDDFVDDGLDVDMDNTPVALPMISQAKMFKVDNSYNNKQLKNDVKKTSTLSNGEAKVEIESEQITPQLSNVNATKVPLSVPQILESNTNNNFILLQLPDCLPGLKIDDKDEPKSKHAPEPSKENKTEKSNNYCTLSDLKEGMLGKLQILRSGNTRLILGDNNLIVELGSNVSFRQDLIAATISGDKKTGNLVNLGRVSSTLICVPDWEDLLKIL